MSVKQIVPGVYQISLSYYNVFLIDSDELILVDVVIPKAQMQFKILCNPLVNR